MWWQDFLKFIHSRTPVLNFLQGLCEQALPFVVQEGTQSLPLNGDVFRVVSTPRWQLRLPGGVESSGRKGSLGVIRAQTPEPAASAAHLKQPLCPAGHSTLPSWLVTVIAWDTGFCWAHCQLLVPISHLSQFKREIILAKGVAP